MAALLRDEKGPDDAELEPECEEVRLIPPPNYQQAPPNNHK